MPESFEELIQSKNLRDENWKKNVAFLKNDHMRLKCLFDFKQLINIISKNERDNRLERESKRNL